ncbi:hypothetical protein AB0J82_37120 [Asanoa sp. NPDC049518]
MADGWLVLSHGIIPYWCESAARPAVDAAERWLAEVLSALRQRLLVA